MHLSPEDIAAAEACGVNFLPASDAQVQRMAMQLKIFYRAGEPILATRGDGFFETVGTLQQLIEEGRRQQQDLAQWLQVDPAGTAAAEMATETGSTAMAEPAEAMVEAPAEAPATASPPAEDEPAPEPMPPKRQRRRRPPAGEPAGPTHLPDLPDQDPALAALPSDASRPASRDRNQRWLVAGATRRGRAGKHWSTRQRG